MNNQKLRIARIKRMADKKFGRHKCPNNNQKLRIARIARIFNDKIRRHKCPNCYGFLSAAAIRIHRTLASQNFRKIISVKSAKSVVKQLNINN